MLYVLRTTYIMHYITPHSAADNMFERLCSRRSDSAKRFSFSSDPPHIVRVIDYYLVYSFSSLVIAAKTSLSTASLLNIGIFLTAISVISVTNVCLSRFLQPLSTYPSIWENTICLDKRPTIFRCIFLCILQNL